jgi:flagellar basal-body rod protein FlgG
MLRILWNSKSAMIANQDKLDSISNNLANANTDGYKRIDVSFKDLMYESLERNGYPISENENRENEPFTGSGVRTSQWLRDQRQGILQETKKTTDIAIDGEGFFSVTRPNGELAYTRAGRFDIDSNGRIVDPNGNILNINFNGKYNYDNTKFSNSNFSVTKDGKIFIAQGEKNVEVGTITLYNAYGSNSMKSVGDNLFVPAEDAQVYEVDDSDLLQGLVEGSNVDMVNEMTELMVTQRAFELSSKGIKMADEMWGLANSLKGR